MGSVSKKDIFKEFSNLGQTIKELTSKIQIEDFFNIVDKDNNDTPLNKEVKITYGVNVRLSKDADDDFFPFSYSYPRFDSAEAVKGIDPDNMIQGFLNRYSLKEISFTAEYDKENKISVRNVDSLSNPVKKDSNESSNSTNEPIETWLEKEDTFLHANLNKLCNKQVKKESYFVWICGEDPDVTPDGNCGYLTNIMVITNDEDLRNKVKKKKTDFIEFVMWLKSRRSYDSDVKFKLEAIKSAKAAIMSRNMSHNLGSHVMSYLKQNLSSVKNIFHDRILALLVEDCNSLRIDTNIQEAIREGDQGILPFLVGLGQFISYIQERQDFIATIATDFIPYLSTVNFKDFIYDELNPDKRYERHTTRSNYKTDNILLGNIARSEGLGRKTSPTEGVHLNNIVLKFRDFDGDPVEQNDENGHPTGKARIGRELEFATLKDMRTYNFSLPGGVVGRQAIFSIVENVIRNAAKHGNWREKGLLELTFNIFTKEEIESTIINDEKDAYNKKCLDDSNPNNTLSLREVFNRFYLPAKDAKDLYFVTLTDNLSMDEQKLDKLRKAIDEPLVDKKGKMNEASKGIKEMRISSTWLRSLNEGEGYNPIKYKRSDDQLEITPESEWSRIGIEQNAPVLYARISDGHLQYIFCVLRPKKVAIISTRFEKDDNKDISGTEYNEKAFLKYSWAAFTPKQYHDERNKSYEFIIYDDTDINTNDKEYGYDALKQLSSSRFWKLSDINDLCEKGDNGQTELFNKIHRMTDDDVKGVLTPLYKKLSHYEEGDFIIIDDKTASGNVKRDTEGNNPVYKKSDHIIVKDGITAGTYKYIYRTHHDTETQYENFIKAVKEKTIEGNIFVEGITGNNSTDRLIRNERMDEVWFYKHLHAMKEQIAIFDERLFTKIFGLEEAHLKTEDMLVINDSNRQEYRKRFKKEIINGDNEKWESLLNKNFAEQDKILMDAFKSESGHITSKEEADVLTGIVPIVYKQKGIFIFTLIQDPNPSQQNTFNLYGLSKSSDLTKGSCKKIASLSWDTTNGLTINGEITNENNNYKRFDCISIHQGLLDKLYEVFGIKDKPQEKERLTKQLHEAFSTSIDDKPLDLKKSSTVAEQGDLHILPGMCIHSGRSKPSEIDMPQKLPFIQYASIENAVLDCKYSLVELLDFARYE